MRIAYVSADPGVPVFGRKGCSIHVQEVLRALLKRGAQIDLFATSCEGDRPPGLEAVKLRPLPPSPKGDQAAREQLSLAANRDLGAALEEACAGASGSNAFDLIYERYSLWCYAGMEFARASSTPGLLEVNAPLIEEQSEHRGLIDRASAGRVAEKVFSAATALIAVSEGVASYLERFPNARGKVHVIPNGVDPARFPEGLKPTLVSTPGTVTVGFVGTLKPWHGLSILVDAFAQLHALQPDVRLLIVGDGPERGKIEADLAARKLSEAIHFTGAVAASEVPGLLASMDLAVAPYPESANFYFSPLKVYEYMAAGLPVVASRIGQLERLIHNGVTGILVRAGDAVELVDALTLLHDKPDFRQKLGRAARESVFRNHTWDKVVEESAGLVCPELLTGRLS